MLPLTTMTATRPAANAWMVAIYSAVASAIVAFATALLFQAELPILYVIAYLLIGVAPVVGCQLATGQLGSDWKPLIGGLIGFILPVIGWPILVGALTKGQSIGKLFVASLVGSILGAVVLLLVATVMGQSTSWPTPGFVLAMAVWGGVVGAAMAAWRNPD